MDELKVYSWCDQCFAEGEQRVEAAGKFQMAIDPHDRGRPHRPRLLALCEQHAKPVMEMREMLIKLGVPVDQKSADVKATPKATTPKEPRPPQPTTVEQPTLPDVSTGQDKIHAPCPICSEVLRRTSIVVHLQGRHGCRAVAQPKKCPECGGHFDPINSMLIHRRRMHDYDYLADVVATAKRR